MSAKEAIKSAEEVIISADSIAVISVGEVMSS